MRLVGTGNYNRGLRLELEVAWRLNSALWGFVFLGKYKISVPFHVYFSICAIFPCSYLLFQCCLLHLLCATFIYIIK